jgi:hypothetical protein
MILRRTGYRMTFSDSSVVKPVPVNADIDWNRAESRDNPVSANATVAVRWIKIDTAATARNERSATNNRPRIHAQGSLK